MARGFLRLALVAFGLLSILNIASQVASARLWAERARWLEEQRALADAAVVFDDGSEMADAHAQLVGAGA
jgi:hypothetical protein